MAINVSFNGSTIYKPGAYSKTTIDLGGGFPLSPSGLVAIFGESEAGTPGAQEVNIANNVFSPEQLTEIRLKYKSGPIVDACNFLFAPGADGAIPSGAQAVYIYKTNASVRAQLAVAGLGTVRALEYGAGGNKLTYKVSAVPASSATALSTTPVDLTVAGTGTDTLVVRVNGGADNTWTSPSAAATDTVAKLQAELNNAANWSAGLPALTIVVGGTDNAATITLTRSASGTPATEGYGRNFEVVASTVATSFGIAAGLKVAAAENKAMVTISNKGTLIDESATVGGDIVLKIGRNGGTTPTVEITATQIILSNAGSPEYTLNKSDYGSVAEVVAWINSAALNWSAEAGTLLLGQLAPSVLDQVSPVGALATGSTMRPAQIKRDAALTKDFFAQSSNVFLDATIVKGLPVAASETYLAGGAKGGTSTSEIVNALAKFEKIRVNAIVPLMSRDASDDIADQLTEATSNYTIDGIHQAVKTHLSLMSTTKRKSERQGYLSIHADYETCKIKAQTMADARIQMTIQDIRQIDAAGTIKWFQPWALAAMLAGARGGSPVGTPMTFKFLNCSGIRHTGQAMSTPEADIVMDFDPDTQYEDAIQNGITFMEAPQSGGFRVVVDNTTYGKDGNWVYNRANVLYAADIVAYDFRNQLENIYIGVKNTVQASEVKSVCESILNTYLAQGITVSASDAPNGYKGLTVSVVGNTINIAVVIKLVEGIDFILADITLQRATTTA